MNISGNHQFNNYTNNGQTRVNPRTFPSPRIILLWAINDLNIIVIKLNNLSLKWKII